MEIRLTWTKLDHSPALEDYFRNKVEHLEHFFQPILSADLELAHDHRHRKGRMYRAEARLAVPKKSIYAAEVAEHPYEAVDLLIERLQSQLDDLKERNIKHSARSLLRGKKELRRRLGKRG